MNFISVLAFGSMAFGFLILRFAGKGNENKIDDDPTPNSHVFTAGFGIFFIGLGMVLLVSPTAKLGCESFNCKW